MCNHPRSIFCILPPHILRNIARNGNREERDFALHALGLDTTMRTSRLTFTLMDGLKTPHPSAAIATPTPKRQVYDAGHTEDLPGKLIRAEDQAAVSDVAVNQAYDGLGDTFDFYLKAYERNSINNAGI